MWSAQVERLKQSIEHLSETSPDNIILNFCTQSIEHEFCHELTPWKTTLGRVMQTAVNCRHCYDDDVRIRAARALHASRTHAQFYLDSIRLADIRNMVVFEVYKQCNITVDTYFERYSSPPGTAAQNEAYARIAHGRALGMTAEHTQRLWSLVMSMQVLKRFFYISDILDQRCQMQEVEHMLRFVGDIWVTHIKKYSLGDLIWQLFLDIYAVVSLQSTPPNDR